MITVIIGFFSGILSGMGIGGGMILIPALRFFSGVNQHIAQTTNLFYFIPTAIAAIIVHIKNKNIDKGALRLIIGGVPLSLLGAYIASSLSSQILSKLFAVFILIFGISEIIQGIKEFKKI